jgi:hypothetical protein
MNPRTPPYQNPTPLWDSYEPFFERVSDREKTALSPGYFQGEEGVRLRINDIPVPSNEIMAISASLP